MMIVDFHSHILPGIDDGSASVEESIALLRREAEQGIRHVVATPHFYARHDTPEQFLTRRREAELRLREEMERHSGLPQLSIGAEVHFFSGMSHSDSLSQLTIDKKGCILLEMPMCHWTDAMYREVENIWARQGITPVIAHVDRYLSPFRTSGIPERLEAMPVYVQANAGFFLRPATRRMALNLLKKDQVQLLGSDCHNLSERAPNLGPALAWIQKQTGLDLLRRIESHQSRLLEDAPL